MAIYLPEMIDKIVTTIAGLKANWQDYDTHKADYTAMQFGTVPITSIADKTYYIDGTSGNDSNDGLSEAKAFKTWGKAVSLLPLFVSHNYVFRFIGNYTGDVTLANWIQGGGTIVIRGNTDTALSHKISGGLNVYSCVARGIDSIQLRDLNPTGQLRIYGSTGCYLRNMAPRYSGADGAVLVQTSIALIRDCNFGSNVVARAIAATYGSNVVSRDNAGNATEYGLHAEGGSVIAKWGTQPTGTTANENSVYGGVVR